MATEQIWTEEVWEAYERRQARAIRRKIDQPGEWIEISRVGAVIEAWSNDFEASHNGGNDEWRVERGYGVLAARCGVAVRTIYRIVSPNNSVIARQRGRSWTFTGGELYLGIDIVDRIFVGMDCVQLFHMYPEKADGSDGFADVYFHPSVIEAEPVVQYEEHPAELFAERELLCA